MSDAFDKAKAAETVAKAELAAAGVTLAQPTVTPRKRRTDAEIAADLQRKLDTHKAKVAERERKEAEKAERKELERKRKVLAGLAVYDIGCIEAALKTRGDGMSVAILAALRGEGA